MIHHFSPKKDIEFRVGQWGKVLRFLDFLSSAVRLLGIEPVRIPKARDNCRVDRQVNRGLPGCFDPDQKFVARGVIWMFGREVHGDIGNFSETVNAVILT